MSLTTHRARILAPLFAATTLSTAELARADLSDGLVSYWPMEAVQGTKTPDLLSGYDMNLNNLTATDLVAGKFGKCFSFANARQTLLSRVHQPGEELPINKHAAFTVSFWANATGAGQADLRLFSEGFNPNNTDPLFNIGTDSTGSSGQVDVFLRQAGWTTVNHIKSTAEPFDGTWHHIVFTQKEDGSRTLYVDGVADSLEIPVKETGDWNLNDTTIGGILRASASHWVTGLIDEVALWKRALSETEIKEVGTESLTSVFPPEAVGLVSHWPMEVVQGTKTPDVVSGYDMNLNNLTAADLVAGKIGMCFSFTNARQTLLSRVHQAGEDLPINKHPAFSISFWANATGAGQADLRFFSEGFNPNNTDPLFNIGTDSAGASGQVDVFLRQAGWTTVNHIKSTAEPFDGTWHHIAFVQQDDGSRTLYVDGVADDLEIPDKEAGAWNLNDTTIGGILRASASHWVTGLIDEVALWKRALSAAELDTVRTNGVPKVITKKQPLEIKSFAAEFPAAAIGDSTVLHWEGSPDANYSIIPGVGDVTGQTQFGVGSKQVTVNATASYTLVATRGSESLSRVAEVKAVSGVASGWHWIDTFSYLNPGNLAAQSYWLGAEGVFTVTDFAGNKVIGYDDGLDLTAIPLKAFSITEGQKGTMHFRVHIPKLDPDDPVTPIVAHVGLTERSIRGNGDFAQNVGPYLRIERLADGSTIDLQARNGVATGIYEGQFTDAIQPDAWYRIWIDVENRPFDVVDGVQNGGDLYAAYIQKDGDASRTKLFEGYLADRDAVTIDPALGAPTKDLIYLFVVTTMAGQGVNRVLFDDFFISVGAYNSTIPYVPTVGPTEIIITGYSYDTQANTFSLTWGSDQGISYIVQRRNRLDEAWTNLTTGYPTGGATAASTSYTDNSPGQSSGFYRVVYQP